jgi:hypothetical protein
MHKRVVLLGGAFALALGLALSPIQISSDGIGIDTAAAAGKSGGNDCPPVKQKGNNGWGNGGGDGINPGSDEGTFDQASTKSADAER